MMESSTSPNAYLEGPYAPVFEEITARDLEVQGEIPRDLTGTFVRNGANPKLPPKGRYHWFDGDGMLHAVELANGKASYRNRFVRTKALNAEIEAGEPLWTGILEPVDLKNPRGPFKNTANTDLVFHAGKLLALWWQSGLPYQIRLPDLETCGEELFGKDHKAGISAHPKVDPRTGEMMFIAFGQMRPPFLQYGVIDAKGELAHFVPIESVPGPRYQHDIAITEHFTILMDLPMYADPEMLKVGKSRVRFFREQPARFGLIPRYGRDADVKWFNAEACYVYHTINAWEEGPPDDPEVVMVGCRIADPLMGDPRNPTSTHPIPSIGLQRLEPYLHEWRFHLKTGAVRERRLGDVMVEFPRMDNRLLGVKSRYSFNPKVAHAPTVLFEGLIKHDFVSGKDTTHLYPEGWSAGEAVVCPREGSTGEDDAYVVTFAIEHASGRSELWIWSARDFGGAPLARVKIPQRVPAGYHAWWIHGGVGA